MTKIPIVLCALVASACTVPMPLQVASWAADGIAYLTTEKSVTDHGLSLVAGKDCALWRGIKGEEICRVEEEEDQLDVYAENYNDGGN